MGMGMERGWNGDKWGWDQDRDGDGWGSALLHSPQLALHLTKGRCQAQCRSGAGFNLCHVWVVPEPTCKSRFPVVREPQARNKPHPFSSCSTSTRAAIMP